MMMMKTHVNDDDDDFVYYDADDFEFHDYYDWR